jgi:O-antigen ligase
MNEASSPSPPDLQALLLGGLLAVLPFEARRPVLAAGPFTVTVLEAGALAVTALLLGRERRGGPWRLAAPVGWMLLLAGAYLLSAALAADHAGRATKFALRLCLAAVFAIAVARLPPRSVARGLWGLVVGGVLVAALAIAEGGGLRALDPWLDLFREQPFNVGGVRRASAGSEYPNLAGAILMYALVALGGLAASGRVSAALVAAVAVLTAGLLSTYSRAALVGALAGLAVIAAAHRGRAPRACLVVLAAGALVFTAGRQAFALRLSTEGVDSWYGADYAPAVRSLRLRPEEALLTAIRVTNRGRLPWDRDRQFHLSYHWYGVERRDLVDGGRTRLPRDVGPGETVLLQAEVRAPAREGRYLLLWDMVQEHTSWFSGQGVPPGVVQAWVGSGKEGVEESPALFQAEPLAWRPGRRVLWPLALRMWRADPWTGAGPDSFRWSYGRWAGRATWDTRVFANNAYLEVAATTGLAGLLAFLGTLGSATRAAWSARETGPAALAALGLLVALAVHGLADYVFAFTGHYLVVGLVVGAAASVARPEAAP